MNADNKERTMLKKVIIGLFAGFVLTALVYQALEQRAFKAAWAKDVASRDKTLLAMKASMEAINQKHDPAIADLQGKITSLQDDTTKIKDKILGIHVPTVGDVLAMAADASVACETRLASTVESFTTCRSQVDNYATLTLSQDQEIKYLNALDIERQAKDKETQVAFKECLTNYEKQAASLALAERSNHWLIVYAGAGGSITSDGKIYPSLQLGVGIKLAGLAKKPKWMKWL
jgi:hypothetical protein